MNRSCQPVLMLLLLLVLPASAEEEDLASRLRGLVSESKWTDALGVADAALETAPDLVVAWQYRAYSLHRLGRLPEAGAAYEKTVALDPKNWWAFLNLAELRAAQKRRTDAVKAAGRAVGLNPLSTEVRTRVSRIHREAGEYEIALSEALLARVAGVDAGWCDAELGYLYWVLGNLEKSREHWKRAREEGVSRDACRHALTLLDWDRPRGSPREKEEIRRRRLGFGDEWKFTVDGVEVRTRVGPRLPAEIERLIAMLRKEQAAVLGVGRGEEWSVFLHLSRTLEEHERHREREFPAGYSGKAFVVPRWTGGWGRRGGGRRRSALRRHELDVYLAWSEPGLERSLAHELAHAMVRLRIPRASWPPVWLDEGIATHLEVTADERGRRKVGRVRADLIAVLDRAAKDGTLRPLATLLGAERPEFTGPNARVRYAQSWALAHWLIEGQKSGGKQKWQAFLDRWNAPGRAVPGAHLEAVYESPPAEIEKAVAAHLARIR